MKADNSPKSSCVEPYGIACEANAESRLRLGSVHNDEDRSRALARLWIGRCASEEVLPSCFRKKTESTPTNWHRGEHTRSPESAAIRGFSCF